MSKALHRSTKTYGHDLGFSVAFRQWRAQSHCRLLHGYSLAFRFEFAAEELDPRNWVVDFGGLKGLKAMLEQNFDHKTVFLLTIRNWRGSKTAPAAAFLTSWYSRRSAAKNLQNTSSSAPSSGSTTPDSRRGAD